MLTAALSWCIIALFSGAAAASQPHFRITYPGDGETMQLLSADKLPSFVATAWFPPGVNISALLPLSAGLLICSNRAVTYNFETTVKAVQVSNVIPRFGGNGTDVNLVLNWHQVPGTYRMQIALLYGNNGQEVHLTDSSAVVVTDHIDVHTGRTMPVVLTLDPHTYLLSQVVDFSVSTYDQDVCTVGGHWSEPNNAVYDEIPHLVPLADALPATVTPLNMTEGDLDFTTHTSTGPVLVQISAALKWCQYTALRFLPAQVHQAAQPPLQDELLIWLVFYTSTDGSGTACEPEQTTACTARHERLLPTPVVSNDGTLMVEAGFYPDPASRYYAFIIAVSTVTCRLSIASLRRPMTCAVLRSPTSPAKLSAHAYSQLRSTQPATGAHSDTMRMQGHPTCTPTAPHTRDVPLHCTCECVVRGVRDVSSACMWGCLKATFLLLCWQNGSYEPRLHHPTVPQHHRDCWHRHNA